MLAMLAGTAHAQYQWRDPHGRMVFSDQPPPPGTPADRILRSPPPAPAAQASATTPVTAAKPEHPAIPSYKDRLLANEKQRAEQQENAKKRLQAERENTERAHYCQELKAERVTLASGARIATVDANGQRSFVDDAQRQQRLERNAQAISETCGS